MAEPRLRVGGIGSPEGVALEDETGAEVLRVAGGAAAGRFYDTGGVEFTLLQDGGRPDGVTDNTPELLALLEQCRTQGGGVIRLLPGHLYRIGFPNAPYTFPDNTHIYAHGARIRCPDAGVGICLRFQYANGSSINGGVWDGNWNGGAGQPGAWGGADGVIANPPGTSGTLPALSVSHTTDCQLNDLVVRQSVNDGISGAYNNRLTLTNVRTYDTAEHGYYFSYSEWVRYSRCHAVNFYRNNWGKGGVGFKCRQGRHHYLNDVEAHVELANPNGGSFMEGSGEHVYVDGLHATGIGGLVYFTDLPTHFGSTNNNLHMRRVRAHSRGGANTFSIAAREDCSIEDAVLDGFETTTLLDKAVNVTIRNARGSQALTTPSSAIVEARNVRVENCSGYMSLNGQPGSRFEDWVFVGPAFPLLNRLYANHSTYAGFAYEPPPEVGVGSPFYIYTEGGEITLERWEVANVNFALTNATDAGGGIVNLRDCVVKNSTGMFSDSNGVPREWRAIRCETQDSTRLANLQAGATLVHGGCLRMGSTTMLASGSGTVIAVPVDG